MNSKTTVSELNFHAEELNDWKKHVSMELSEEEKKAVVDVWHTLMKKKKIQVRTVHDEISKEMLSETQLRDPKINEKVKKYSKYSIQSIIHDSSVI